MSMTPTEVDEHYKPTQHAIIGEKDGISINLIEFLQSYAKKYPFQYKITKTEEEH